MSTCRESQGLNASNEDSRLAIVGIGCRLPGGISSPEEYWHSIKIGLCAIGEIPKDRWATDGFYDPDPSAIACSTTKWGGFLSDIRQFDAEFFGISPREAASMDPQQRLLLHVVYEALQDSWTTLEEATRRRAGVFVGVSTSDYGTLQRYRRTNNEVYAGTGSALSIVANRVSHRLNLSGPSFAADTACSSSLVALDQACLNLKQDACDIAIVAGVNILADPGAFVAFSKAGMMSPTGQISTFDARANGYVRGEGVGAVIIKRLKDARRDGDRIYAQIRATSVNQDGRTLTLTAPAAEAQQRMLEELCRRADVNPHAVGYVEAHGTGTPIGDPIEAGVIGRVFGQGRKNGPVWVGSVKPNIGHLESAAGISGLIKSTLSVWHGEIAPNINFDAPNPNIPFDALNIAVPDETAHYDPAEEHRIAVVNSFGFGGTNASVLLQSDSSNQPRTCAGKAEPKRRTPPEVLPVPVPISAGSELGLRQSCGQLADLLDHTALGELPLAELSASLGSHRDHLSYRAALFASSRAELTSLLRAIAADEVEHPDRPALRAIVEGKSGNTDPKIAFTFSGQGGQWWGMARKLLTEVPVFGRAVAEFDECFKAYSGWSVTDELLRSEPDSKVHHSAITQPSIFAVQIGLAELWRSMGVRPDLVIGHSFGEVAAAKVAGALNMESAAQLICLRGQVGERVHEEGGMLAVQASADFVTDFLTDLDIDIAAFNGPAAVTLSAKKNVIDAAEARFAEDTPEIRIKRLAMNTAWHSRMLDPVEKWFRKATTEIQCQAPSIPIISTVTGKLHVQFDADYWWQNLRCPVSYQTAIELALKMQANMFIELAPHRTLSGLTSACASATEDKVSVINSIYRGADDLHAMTLAAGEAYVEGARLDWHNFCEGQPEKITLPRYAWDCREYWSDSEESRRLLGARLNHPLLGLRSPGPKPEWTHEINLNALRYLSDHRVDGDCIYPAAGYIEMMFAAGSEHFGKLPVELSNLTINEALFLAPDDEVLFNTTFNEQTGHIHIHSRLRDGPPDWTLRASAKMASIDVSAPKAARGSTAKAVKRIGNEAFYQIAEKCGFGYGPAFSGLREARLLGRKVFAHVSRPDGLPVESKHYNAHPALLDACLQCAIATTATPFESARPDDETTYPMFLPTGVASIRLFEPMGNELNVSAALNSGESGSAKYDYTIANDGGGVAVQISGFELAELAPTGAASDESTREPAIYSEQFIKASEEIEPVAGSCDFLILAGSSKTTGKLVSSLRAAGHAVTVMSPSQSTRPSDQELAKTITDWISADRERAAVVFAEPLLMNLYSGDAVSLPARIEESVLELVKFGKSLKQLEAKSASLGVWILTQEGRPFLQSDACGLPQLGQSACIPLARTIAAECGDLRIRQVDCCPLSLRNPKLLSEILCSDPKESEIVLRGEEIWVPRIEVLDPKNVEARSVVLDAKDTAINFAVTMSTPGNLGELEIVQTQIPNCADNEVLLETAAVGLNFRDIMAATGLLPAEAEAEPAWLNLGMEFSANVRSVGRKVKTLRAGDRVIGMGRHCLQQVQCLPADVLVKLPDNVSLTEGATIPSVFCTAHYALNNIARIKKDDKVLIHAATGGVGLAAIQLAQRVGAEIFATAGSKKKRAYLRKLGVRHVMNSRSLEFADQIKAITKGRGVDVILNSLPGQFIIKGLDVLAPFGHFLEIGKRDVYKDSVVGLKALRRNVSLSVIDLAAMAVERPDMMADLFAEVMEMFASGELTGLPVSEFDINDVEGAFRFMSRAQHIGKVVVSFTHDQVKASAVRDRAPRFLKTASYLITGGSRGFGIMVADWLSEHGAGKIILASRSGQVDATENAAIERIRSRDTLVEMVSLDVTDYEAVSALLGSLPKSSHPLDGVFHGAAVIRDGFLEQLDDEQVLSVLRPKITGGWNLHRALMENKSEPRFFVCFSSLSQMLGSMGQANYVAANGFLDMLASYRQALGKPALTIDWGALGEVGFVARSEGLAGYLESVGMTPLSSADAKKGLASLMQLSLASSAYAAIDWSANARSSGGAADVPRLAHVIAGGSSGAGRVRTELANAPEEQWVSILQEYMIEEVVNVLKVERVEVDPDLPLTEMGFDSLSSIELKNRIESQIGVSVSVGTFLQTPTLSKLAGVLSTKITENARSAAAEQDGKAGAGQAEAKNARSKLSISDLQKALVRQTLSPLTSDAARIAQQNTVTIKLPQSLDLESVNKKLGQLARRHPALMLVLDISEEGGTETLSVGRTPLAKAGNVAQAAGQPLNVSEGELLRVVHQAGRRDTTHISLTAHSSALDQRSLCLVADDLMTSCAGEKLPPSRSAKALRALVDARCFDDENGAHQAARAFFVALLEDVPNPVQLPRRKRALAPYGLGQDHGWPVSAEAGVRLAGWGKLSNTEKEARLCVAFAATLAGFAKVEDLLLSRCASVRPPAGAAGAFEHSLPLPIRGLSRGYSELLSEVEHTVRHVAKHGGACDILASGQLDDLFVDSNASPEQFGIRFQPIDVENAPAPKVVGATGRREISVNAGCWHDVFMDIAETKGGVRIRAKLDEDVFDMADAEKLLSNFLVMLEKLSGHATKRASDIRTWKNGGAHRTLQQVRAATRLSRREPERKPKGTGPAQGPASVADTETFKPYSNQKYILDLLERPDSTPTHRLSWVLAKAFMVKPSIDLGRLRAAIGTVQARHDSLRSTFHKVDGNWTVRIAKELVPAVTVRDLGDVSRDAVLREAKFIIEQDMDITAGPLIEVYALQTNSHGDCLLVRAHHLIVDAWSNLVLLEDLIKSYLGMPIVGKAMTHKEYARRIEELYKSPEIETMNQYWLDYAKKTPINNHIGRVAKGLRPNASGADLAPTQRLQLALDADDHKELVKRAKKVGTTPFALIAASYVATMARLANQEDVSVRFIDANRTDSAVGKFVGFVGSIATLACHAGPAVSMEELAVNIYKDMLSHRAHSAPGYELPSNANGKTQSGRFSMSSFVPTDVAKRSPFAKVFQSALNQKFSAFSFDIEALPVELPTILGNELDLRATIFADSTHLALDHDILAFTSREARQILVSLVKNLGFKASARAQIETFGPWGAAGDIEALSADYAAPNSAPQKQEEHGRRTTASSLG